MEGLKNILYVLKLENDKYYVGKTNNLDRRISEHQNGKGSFWTKTHKFVSVIEVQYEMNSFHEDMLVKLYMKKFGISNVRGGTYSTLILTADQIKFLDTEITHSKNLCFHCKKDDHYIKNCPLLIKNECKVCLKYYPYQVCDKCQGDNFAKSIHLQFAGLNIQNLSPTIKETFNLLIQGKTVYDIVNIRHLTVRTIHNHISDCKFALQNQHNNNTLLTENKKLMINPPGKKIIEDENEEKLKDEQIRKELKDEELKQKLKEEQIRKELKDEELKQKIKKEDEELKQKIKKEDEELKQKIKKEDEKIKDEEKKKLYCDCINATMGFPHKRSNCFLNKIGFK